MKKSNLARRVLCLVLGILMLTSLLTACDNAGNVTSTEAAKAMTITLTMIKEEGMTDDGIKAVQAALNEITENRYNTHVVLQMFTADEYAEKVMEMSQKLDINNAAAEDSTYVSNEVILEEGKIYKQTANGDYYLVDEQNRSHVQYPTLVNTQLDVLFIDDISTYTLLAKGDGETPYLAELGEVIGKSDLPVAKYVNSTLLSHARRVNGKFLAVPNNSYYGDYSYMLVNKKYFDELNYDISLVTDFSGLESFIFDVANKTEYDKVAPVYNAPDFNFLTYFDFESPLLTQPNALAFDTSNSVKLNNMTRMGFYQTSMEMLYKLSKLPSNRTYKETTEVDFNADFAVAFMDGAHTIPETYKDINNDGTDDYYVVELSRPVVGNEMFSSMYAVSQFSQNKERAFEILALLQADADVVNLLAYGIKNVHYELDNKGVVTFKEDSNYFVDYKKAGNNFLCYPNENMDEATLAYAENEWALAKKHNEKLRISPYCGFYILPSKFSDFSYFNADETTSHYFKELDDKTGVMLVDKDGAPVKDRGLTKIYLYNDVMLAQFEEYSKTFVPRMTDFEAASDYESYKAYLKALSDEFQATDIFSQIQGVNTGDNNTESNAMSPAGQYNTFYLATYK